MDEYCCKELEEAMDNNDIQTSRFPSGIEYYMVTTDTLRDLNRVYYCPFCGKSLE